MVDYFTNIFKSNGPFDASPVINAIKPVVTDVMNTSLTQDFQVAEVIKALKQIHPKKAAGPDGMPLCFINVIGLQLVIVSPKLSWIF